jgi:hypothetical protein
MLDCLKLSSLVCVAILSGGSLACANKPGGFGAKHDAAASDAGPPADAPSAEGASDATTCTPAEAASSATSGCIPRGPCPSASSCPPDGWVYECPNDGVTPVSPGIVGTTAPTGNCALLDPGLQTHMTVVCCSPRCVYWPYADAGCGYQQTPVACPADTSGKLLVPFPTNCVCCGPEGPGFDVCCQFP